jgi:hypothetical protein
MGTAERRQVILDAIHSATARDSAPEPDLQVGYMETIGHIRRMKIRAKQRGDARLLAYWEKKHQQWVAANPCKYKPIPKSTLAPYAPAELVDLDTIEDI